MNNENLVTKDYLDHTLDARFAEVDAKIEQMVNRITNRLAVVIGIATALLGLMITFG